MDKLQIKARMKTPFIAGGGYMTFDGLLAGILFDQLQDVDLAHSSVPIKCSNGLFHASAAIYELLDKSRIGFVANLRAEHSLHFDQIHKNKAGDRLHTRLGRTRRGDYGPVMNNYDSYFVDTIDWHVEGDADAIRKLVEPVLFIGKKRASGFGEVSQWEIQTSDLGGLIGDRDDPLRPIPCEMFKGDPGSIKVEAAWRPAYWNLNHRAICFAPDFTHECL
ncbi:hypothetical protein N9L66_03370 [Porticoccaceae bacterium]|nr:hypothetical protein [Porticoccaceae bacterium]MDB2343112.1 hypothetical protein [Porticoccaceae bacterium]